MGILNKTTKGSAMVEKKINVSESHLFMLSKQANYSAIDALNELIDNAKDYGATECEINYNPEDSILTISDNGNGMNVEELENAFNLGMESTGKFDSNAAGYFGTGMKTAIMNLCNITDEKNKLYSNVTIVSRKENGDGAMIDYNVSRENNMTYKIAPRTDIKIKGTTIIIKNTAFTPKNFAEANRLLGTIYYPILKDGKFKIFFNNKTIHGEDPLYRDITNNTDAFFSDSVDVNINAKKYTFDLIVSNLDVDNVPQNKLHAYDGGMSSQTKGCKRGIKATNRSGIYVIYGNRYICLGNNLTLVDKELQPNAAGIRLEMRIPKELTFVMGVQWNKTSHLKPFTDVEGLEPLVNMIRKIFAWFIEINRNKSLTKNQKNKEKKLTKDVIFNGRKYTVNINTEIDACFPYKFDPISRKITINLGSQLFTTFVEKYGSDALKYIIPFMNSMILGVHYNGLDDVFRKCINAGNGAYSVILK